MNRVSAKDEIPVNAEFGKFRSSLQREFAGFLRQQQNRWPDEDCLRIDLHCHDANSDVTDELWGRILGIPETWLKTKKLVKVLKSHGCNAITITNHNNARSCWELEEKGEDVLTAAEFTCVFPQEELFVHVLTYGFDREQEKILNQKRKDIYAFLKFAASQNIPVILPHPLYFYTKNDSISVELFEKFAVLFQRFEVLNGQRDLWQRVLTLNWAQSLTPEKIRIYAQKHGLNPAEYGVDPDVPKVLTGGSDDHMGIFAGQCGSVLHIPNLRHRLKTEKASDLALEAIRAGNIAPFGQVAENQKLNIALLDYFAQIATKMEDPGLLRILFHRGEFADKAFCFAIANFLLEMKKHKNTNKFFNFTHEALKGKKPNKLVKWKISKDYRFCIEHLEKIADSKRRSPEEYIETVNSSVGEMFTELNRLIIKRFKKTSFVSNGNQLSRFSTEEIARKMEVPSQLTSLFFGGQRRSNMSGLNVGDLLDNLSFPMLISAILTGATLASTRVLYQNRKFLNDFASHLGKNRHERRALYLTDTLCDKNGVSSSLSGKLREIQKNNYPIDFLICHPYASRASNLHVVRPLSTFSAPKFGDQEFRIPDLLEIARIFYEGGYDRIVCSTEGPMAIVALFIKYMFNVPSYFFMHTDWLDFIKHTTDLSDSERDRVRRLLRAFYKQFDGIFVLNSEHRDWLIGREMEIQENRVMLTAHHSQPRDNLLLPTDKMELFPDATEDTPVLLVACRVSKEKGLFDLPEIVARVKADIPDVRIVVAGTGPAEKELRAQLPEATFLGWVDKKKLAELYLGLDLFVFPSKFDTFGNVVLESFTHGMPVVAYNCKGPKDIIQDGVNGFLANDIEEFAGKITQYFGNAALKNNMRLNAVLRAKDYSPDAIMEKFVLDLGLEFSSQTHPANAEIENLSAA